MGTIVTAPTTSLLSSKSGLVTQGAGSPRKISPNSSSTSASSRNMPRWMKEELDWDSAFANLSSKWWVGQYMLKVKSAKVQPSLLSLRLNAKSSSKKI